MKLLNRARPFALVAFTATASAAAPSDLTQLDFFEKKIRPVLAKECYECHSADAKKVKGGLLLDTAEGVLKGGDSGPSIVPGKPNKSLLLLTMQHADPDPDLAMPPKKDPLPDQVLADFEQWIKMGAPDPRDGKSTRKLAWDDTTAKNHWAFKPVTTPAVPAPADPKHFVANPIDAFILAKLTEKKLAPTAKADKQTLLRRITYDLTGLPPTAAETDAFLADQSPNAYEKTVDRLLASPAYGERWARHWLDIARYSDTNGDRLNGKRQPLFPFAWTYRDYVINAMNADLPYDQFIREQIAADRLPESKTDKSKLAALGFLTVGKRFMGNENDVLDDRIDVVTKGLMGLTASCARCHDHKFDPIPTKDYYSLHGVFNSSTEPTDDEPVIQEPNKDSAELQEYLAELAKVEKEVDEYHRTQAARLVSGMLDKTGEYLLAVRDSGNAKDTSKKGDNFRLAARQRGLESEVAFVWMDRIKSAKDSDPVLGPWLKLAAIPDEQFAERAPVVAKEIADAGTFQSTLASALTAKTLTSIKDVAAVYTEVFGQLRKELELPAYLGYKGATRNAKFPLAKVEKKTESPLEPLRECVFGAESSVKPPEQVMARALGVQFTNPETAIRAKAVTVDFAHPGSPIRAMAMVDKPNPKDSAVFIRGEPGNRGPIAPRKFLTVLSYGKDEPFKDGSGRRELAERIASRDNPLTARVIVNRTWQWHFGQAIVRTVSDFGTRSEPPTHPELLDYLATWFMDNGWSLKKLHKFMVMSATYQQDSAPNNRGMNDDPTNQWLWRMNVQRLDFEQVRDTLLTVGGKLEREMNGRPFALSSMNSTRYKGMVSDGLELKTSTNRRSVYAMIDRNALPDMFNTFDFANPEMSTGERVLTTVPQQALFLMNSPFVADQVKNILLREDFPKDGIDEEKVRFIFRTVFQRQPTTKELQLARDFLSNDPPEPLPKPPAADEDPKTRARKAIAAKAGQPAKQLTIWERYTQTVLLTNELMFVR